MEVNFENQEEKKKLSKGLLIGFIIGIVLVLIGVGIYFCFIKKDDRPVDNKGNNQQEINNNTNDNEQEKINDEQTDQISIDKSWYGEYTTIDKKHVINIQEGGKITIDNKELIDISIDDKKDDKYLFFRADFNPPQAGITALSFVLNKESKLIEEKPGDEWKESTSECGNWYGEYARFYERCQGFNYLNINNHYFFVIGSEFSDDIYTTDWKKLGTVGSIDELKYDNKGIYVCEDFDMDDMSFKCIKEIKYDYNGNKID